MAIEDGNCGVVRAEEGQEGVHLEPSDAEFVVEGVGGGGDGGGAPVAADVGAGHWNTVHVHVEDGLERVFQLVEGSGGLVLD